MSNAPYISGHDNPGWNGRTQTVSAVPPVRRPLESVPGWFMAVITILLTICALASALFILVVIDVYFALAHLQAELSQLTAPFGN